MPEFDLRWSYCWQRICDDSSVFVVSNCSLWRLRLFWWMEIAFTAYGRAPQLPLHDSSAVLPLTSNGCLAVCLDLPAVSKTRLWNASSTTGFGICVYTFPDIGCCVVAVLVVVLLGVGVVELLNERFHNSIQRKPYPYEAVQISMTSRFFSY